MPKSGEDERKEILDRLVTKMNGIMKKVENNTTSRDPKEYAQILKAVARKIKEDPKGLYSTTIDRAVLKEVKEVEAKINKAKKPKQAKQGKQGKQGKQAKRVQIQRNQGGYAKFCVKPGEAPANPPTKAAEPAKQKKKESQKQSVKN